MNKPLRIIFMGTPGFAIPTLKALLDEGYDIAAVITAPDKQGGRGKKILSSEIKQFAEKESGVPLVLQPTNLKDPGFISDLKKLAADLQIVVAFRMLPVQVWDMPPKGTINLHASLLPQYRGAAPINHAIINGEKTTGVTTFYINDNIDTGKVILQKEIDIPTTFTAGNLHDTLMIEGAKLVIKTVKSIEEGTVEEIPQKDLIGKYNEIKTAPKIFKEDCRIKWDDEVMNVYNFIRGLSPFPTAFSELSGQGQMVSVKIFNATYSISSHNYPAGKIFLENRKRMKVAVRNGFIYPEILQQADKKSMDVINFINGFPDLENYFMK